MLLELFYPLTVKALITNHARGHIQKLKDVCVTAMGISYRDLVAGYVMGTFFALTIFIVGYYAR